jgi:uncharacterized membrane protein
MPWYGWVIVACVIAFVVVWVIIAAVAMKIGKAATNNIDEVGKRMNDTWHNKL